MTKPHKWAKEIKAWADGAEIEYKNDYKKRCWTKCEHPTFEVDEEWEYRIKPQPKEPQYLYVYYDHKLGCSREAYFVSMIKPIEKLMQDYRCIAKIKLEEDDGDNLG